MEADELTKSMAALHVGGGPEEDDEFTGFQFEFPSGTDLLMEAAEQLQIEKETDEALQAAEILVSMSAVDKEDEVLAAAEHAISRENVWQKADTTADERLNLDLLTLDEFASALVGGKPKLEAMKKQVYDKELAAAIVRGSTDPKKSAERAKAQMVRRLFKDQEGDECRGLQGTEPGNCQLCGFAITKETGFTLECEHVFPISQAIFFIDLYRGKKDNARKELLKKEQKLAHRVCNQVKSDTHFLKGNGEIGSRIWSVWTQPIESQLDDLLKSTSQQEPGQNLLKQKVVNVNAWKSQRVDSIATDCAMILSWFQEQCPIGQQKEAVLARLETCKGQFSNAFDKYITATSRYVSPTPGPMARPMKTPKTSATPGPAKALFQTPNRKRTAEQAGISEPLGIKIQLKKTGESGQTPVRTLGPYGKGRRRTRKAKSRNRRTRRKKFTE